MKTSLCLLKALLSKEKLCYTKLSNAYNFVFFDDIDLIVAMPVF